MAGTCKIREKSPLKQEVYHMKRQPEHEQLNCLSVKTLDQVFIMRVKEGLGCSQFEAEALTDLVKEVYFPWPSEWEAVRAGQLVLTAVSADEPGHKPLFQCKMVPVVLTLHAGEEDHEYRLSYKGSQGIVQYFPCGCHCRPGIPLMAATRSAE
jgi:hypothetical protein